MKKIAIALMGLCALLASVAWVQADGAGSTAGVSLLQMTGARANALGDAFTAMNNDITALEFNPASLATLESGHASLQHQTGLSDDSFSKALVGLKILGGAAGVTVGRYDSGRANLYDGTSQKTVTAEQDWTGTLGYGRIFGKVATGLSVRYLSSKLAETYSGSAASLDAGLQIPITEQLRAGISGPLVQTKLKFVDTSESLSKIYRTGIAADLPLNLATGLIPLKLLLDVPYDTERRRGWVAAGAETKIGSLSLRAGYNSGTDVNNVSFGAGFAFSRFDIDYSFGLVNNNFNSLQRISFSMRFGKPDVPAQDKLSATTDNRVVLLTSSPENTPSPTASEISTEQRTKYLVALDKQKMTQGKTYVVQSGETLKDIATHVYGDDNWEGLILYDNRDKIADPNSLAAGTTLTLP